MSDSLTTEQATSDQIRCNYIRSFSLLLIIVLFSLYAYFNACNNDKYGDLLFPVLLFFAIPRYFQYQQQPLSRTLVVLFWSFLGLTVASVLFPPSIYTSAGWLKESLYRLILASGIVVTVLKISRLDQKVLRWGLCTLCLSLFFFAILQCYGVIDKKILSSLTLLRVVEFGWNDKYYAFWFVFLIWGTVALLWRRGKGSTALAVVITICGFWSVFLTTSESAQLAAVVSLIVFLFCHLPFGSSRYPLYMTMFFCMFLVPLCWMIFTPVMPISQDSILYNITQNISGIKCRIPFYDVSTQLIRKEFILGYGFGSALSLPVPPDAFRGSSTLPGGHPHNIVLLFFLEQGVFGFLWLTTAVFLLFNFIYKATLDRKGGPAVWALMISAQVIFSLSFDTWQADVVMIYAMLFVLLLVSVGNTEGRIQQTGVDITAGYFLIFFTVIGVICYATDFFLHSG